MADWTTSVISQYTNSPTLDQWLDNLATYIDPQYNLQQFYDQCWNLDTAVGYGLDVWGRRVGINRTLTFGTGIYFGFTGPTGHSGDSFNAGIYYSGQPITSNFNLTDDSYRQLILAKAAANITNGSIPAFNAILLNLFPGRGNIYVIDNQDMTMDIVSTFSLESFEVAILTTSNVLPVPTGVTVTLIHP